MFPFRRALVPLAHNALDRRLDEYVRLAAAGEGGFEIHYFHAVAKAEQVASAAADLQSSLKAPAERVHVRHGDTLDEVLHAAASVRADLILMGHRLLEGPRRSLARRLAMKAPASVWMVPDGAAARISRILVPVDFSDYSADALKAAADIAEIHGVQSITAMHVYFDEAVATYEGHGEEMQDNEQRMFARFLSPLGLRVQVDTAWEESSHVAHAILRAAEARGTDLIVMATRGRSPSAAILLGSETDHVMTESSIPVLAVKHFGAQMGLREVILDKRFRSRGDAHFG